MVPQIETLADLNARHRGKWDPPQSQLPPPSQPEIHDRLVAASTSIPPDSPLRKIIREPGSYERYEPATKDGISSGGPPGCSRTRSTSTFKGGLEQDSIIADSSASASWKQKLIFGFCYSSSIVELEEPWLALSAAP